MSRGEKITRLAECSWLAQSVFRDWPPLTIPRERVTKRQEITPYKGCIQTRRGESRRFTPAGFSCWNGQSTRIIPLRKCCMPRSDLSSKGGKA